MIAEHDLLTFLPVIILASVVIGGLIAFALFDRLASRSNKWWKSGIWHPPQVIEYRDINGNHKAGRPVGFTGFHLVLSTGEGASQGRELVSADQALDRSTFWKTWRHLGGQKDGWVDEASGEPFDPTE